jgi:hypothetical protein
MPWRPKIDAVKLQRKNNELTFQLVRVREELRKKESHVVGLEILLDERGERVDKLTVQIEQLRRQNEKLNAECEHLAEIVRSEGRSSWPI